MRARLAWVIGSMTLILAGCFIVYLAVVFRWVDCHAESSSPCSADSRYQIYPSIGGLIAGLIMLVESARRRGKPQLWLVAALTAYAVWGFFVDRTFHG